MKKDEIITKLLDHEALREKYNIENLPSNFFEAYDSDNLIVNTVARIVDEMEKPTSERVSKNGLYDKIKQYLNINS
jgi:hypothetical protein